MQEPPHIKTALLISPQPWNHLQISKHHYARALAAEGVEVFFLEPPDTGKGLEFVSTGERGITRIRFGKPAWSRLRFHARPVYDQLELALVRRILKTAGRAFDLVWSFDFDRYANLRKFRSRWTIYHPVDPLSQPHHYVPAKSADLVLSVSETILNPFTTGRTPAVRIPHGVAPPFARLAASEEAWIPGGNIRLGYTGNLTRSCLDTAALEAIVSGHPLVEFHFWGKADLSGEPAPQTQRFLGFLESSPNCRLHGVVSSEQLAEGIRGMDGFLHAYKAHPTQSDLSNAHKVLEYLSTGRAVFSTPLSEYRNAGPELISFCRNDSAEAFAAGFDQWLSRLSAENAAEKQAIRRAFALENTYEAHWHRIKALLPV